MWGKSYSQPSDLHVLATASESVQAMYVAKNYSVG